MSTVTLHLKPCPGCGLTRQVTVPEDDYHKFQAGAHVQDAFPYLDAGIREGFLTGYCTPCWDKLFTNADEPVKDVE